MTLSTVKEQTENMGKPDSPVSKSTSFASSNTNNDDDDEFLEEGGTYLGDIYIPPPFIPVCSMESNGPRMIISKIIIENFKSYQGVQTIRDLHQNFTAVIGPNGSGKSNIIDAMLFVFGYRASNMRTKKVSSLIHNSSRYQKLNSCSVSVIFQSIVDKDADFETIGEEIVVKRTAFKDNSSFYSVNGKRTTFKDIAKLLSGYGIDLNSNRFLILQGEVEQISLMKPKAQNEHDRGMLEYLEDIIGTTRYKEPLEKITEKVEVMTEEHQQKLNRIKLLQRELKDLEGPKNIAVEHLKQKNELIQIENKKYQHYKMTTEKELEKLNAVKEELDENLKTTETSIKDIEKEKANREHEIKSFSKEMNDFKKDYEHTSALFEAANRKDLALQTEMKQINQNRKKFHDLLSKEKVHLLELEQIPEKNSKLIEECNAQLEKLEHEKTKHESHYQKSKCQYEKQNQGFAEERNEISSKLIPLKKTEAELLSVLNMEKAKLNLLQSDENKQKSALEELKTKLQQISQEKETKSNDLNNLLKSKPMCESNVKTLQEELNKLKSREAEIVPRIYSITSQLSEARAEKQERDSQGSLVNFLLNKKAEGLLPGLFGRLGDLGAIDDKYNVAISTACGALEFIVVDNMDTATKALNLLKKYDVGRTTFIALDKQQHLWQHINTKFRYPENAPRLYDLLRIPDERMKPAFYYVLRETLVGNDLEQAMRISYGAKRYRVVSLDGEVIETSGTMSGGGKKLEKGRIGSSVVTDTRRSIPVANTVDFQNLEHMREQLQKELEENSSRQAELENIVTRACKELQMFDMENKKLILEVNSLKEQHAMILNKIDEQEKRVGNTHTDENKVKKLQDEIDKYQNSYEEAVANSEKFEKEVEGVDNKMSELKKNLMDTVEKELKRITKTIEKLSNESSRLKVEINASERNVNKSKNTIAKLESDIKKSEKQILQFKDEGTELEVRAGEFLEKMKELEDKIKESERNWLTNRSGFSEMDKKITALRSSKVDIEQELANVTKNLKEKSASLAHVKSKLSKLKLEDIAFVTVSENKTLKIYSQEELDEMDMKDLDYKAGLISTNLKDAHPNLQAIEEYKNKETQYLTRAKELEALTDQRNIFRNMKDKLNKDRHDNFIAGFKIISLKLKELYQIITMGGDAELDLVDTMLPFAEGVVFNVRPLKKSWKAISDLSGGEKTLASLSLVLALHYYRPSPLYVMDEIDAALDFRNVSIVANYIKDRTKNAQFIIISLRNNMFDLSDRLVCIYKTQDCSKAIVLNNNKVLYNHAKNSQVPNGD